jgi:hypothetical protein
MPWPIFVGAASDERFAVVGRRAVTTGGCDGKRAGRSLRLAEIQGDPCDTAPAPTVRRLGLIEVLCLDRSRGPCQD